MCVGAAPPADGSVRSPVSPAHKESLCLLKSGGVGAQSLRPAGFSVLSNRQVGPQVRGVSTWSVTKQLDRGPRWLGSDPPAVGWISWRVLLSTLNKEQFSAVTFKMISNYGVKDFKHAGLFFKKQQTNLMNETNQKGTKRNHLISLKLQTFADECRVIRISTDSFLYICLEVT